MASLSTYDFSTLYINLPHNLLKDKLVDLIERTFTREGSLYIPSNDRHAFSPLMRLHIIVYGLVRKCVYTIVVILDLDLHYIDKL